MARTAYFRTRSLIAGQVCVLLAAFLFIAFAPPANGRMLLVPVRHAESLLPQAIAQGARVIARGPTAGSLIVEGTRARLADALGWGNVLILAAPQAGCGTPAPERRF